MHRTGPRRNWVKPAVILAVLAFAIWYFFLRGEGPQGGEGPPGMATEVSAVRIMPQEAKFTVELPGRVAAYKIAEIRPQVSGIVVKRYFTEGSVVKRGQQLYQIDIAPYRAEYNSAKAGLQRAQASVRAVEAQAKRYTNLVKINAVSRQEFDDATAGLAQARADVAVAKAALDAAKINMDYTRMFAPITGRIGKSRVTEGALVTAGQVEPLATVQQIDPVYVDMAQSSSEVIRLRRQFAEQKHTGTIPVTLTVDGQKEPYGTEGTLQFSDVTVDEATGAIAVRALFDNPAHELLPGMFVKATITHASQADALLVPQRAVQRNPDGSTSVWVVGEGNKVQPRPITVDVVLGDQWRVADGLQSGDVVVVEGVMKIQPDMEVKPIIAGETPPTVAPAETPQQGQE